MQKITQFFKKKTKYREYSRKKIIFLSIQLFLYAMIADLAGGRIAEIEAKYAYGALSYNEAFGLNYVYLCALSGLFIGLGFWRLLELHWWAKDTLALSRV